MIKGEYGPFNSEAFDALDLVFKWQDEARRIKHNLIATINEIKWLREKVNNEAKRMKKYIVSWQGGVNTRKLH